jgi:hypothetical protein
VSIPQLNSKAPVVLVQRAQWIAPMDCFRVKAVGNPDVTCIFVQRGCGPIRFFDAAPNENALEKYSGYVPIPESTKLELERLANESIAKGTRQIGVGMALSWPGAFKAE